MAKRHLILEAIAKGDTYMSIVRRFAKEWNLSERTVQMIVEDAINYMKQDSTKETLVAMNMERLDNIIAESMQEKDRKSAIKAIDTQNKLAGGYEERVKLETDTEVNLVFDIGG